MSKSTEKEFDIDDFDVTRNRFVVLEAGAGSGKTHALIDLVIKMVRNGTSIRKILMVTFTKAAALEMRQRVRERLEEIIHANPADTIAMNALQGLGGMRISTIHSFCHRVLREFGPEAGFAPVGETVTNGRNIAMDIAQDWVRRDTDLAPLLGKLLRAIKGKIIAKECKLPEAFQNRGIEAFIDERLEEANRSQATNDGNIRQLCTALNIQKHGEKAEELKRIVREQYDVCMIDECQDTDRYQWEIFQTIFGDDAGPRKMLIMVGDRNQAIYGFRGADVNNYILAQDGAETWTLTANNRSSQKLIEIFNQIFLSKDGKGFFRDDKPLPGIRTPSWEGGTEKAKKRNLPEPLKIVTQSDPATVAKEVGHLLVEFNLGRSTPDPEANVAVLTRNGTEALAIHSELIRQGIPASLSTRSSVLSQQLAGAIHLLLSCILKPEKTEARRALLFARPSLFNISMDLDEFIEKHEEDLIIWLRDRRATWTEKGLGAAWTAITNTAPAGLTSIKQSLACTALRSRHLTDLDHIGELLSTREKTEHLTPVGLIKQLALAIDEGAATEDGAEDEQLRPESAYPQVVVQTMHASKGLQYHGVVIPSIGKARKNPRKKTDGLLRNGKTSVFVSEDSPENEFQDLVSQTDKEEARLLYVGLTRACRKVVLLWGESDFKENATGFGPALMKAGLGSNPAEFSQELNLRLPSLKLTPIESAAPDAEEVKKAIVQAEPISISHKHAKGNRPKYSKQNTSYSQLTETSNHGEKRAQKTGGMALPFMEYKGGENAGDALHKLLEELDFQKVGKSHEAYLLSLTERHLKKSGIYLRDPDEKFRKACTLVAATIPKWIGTPLIGSGIKLNNLDNSNRMSEVRFSLLCETCGKHNQTWGDRLKETFRTEYSTQSDISMLAEVDFSEEDINGLLTGSIDLVFTDPSAAKSGKTYILDWKSNMIGKGSDGYGRSGMANAIANNKYHLQYALYAAALHLYMKACKGDDWNYERDFGGCHYLFLRSFGEVEGTGDFHYRPSWNHIKTILETLGHSNLRA
jgi:exodeoxyribonuclease V beta subunit